MEKTVDQKIRIYEQAKSFRSNWETFWQDLYYYCNPKKAYVTRTRSPGGRLPVDIYDSTAIIGSTYFAAGMQTYMSSPQTKWFSIGLEDKSLMTNRRVLDNLKDIEDALYGAINDSNFYQEDVESYSDLGIIGTSILYEEDDVIDDIRFSTLPIESVVVLEDSKGRVTSAYIEYEFTSYQAYEKFGEKNSTKIKEAFAKKEFTTKFKFLFCIMPREYYDQSKRDFKNMPYEATWIDKEAKITVKEGGFREFPLFVSRFSKVKNDPYGFSPAMNVFADIKMLNAMEETNIIAAQLAVSPPYEVAEEAFMRPLNFNPRGINIRNAGYVDEHIKPIITGVNLPLGLDYLKYKQERVQQAFFNDLFIAIQQLGNMTATEVNIRNNQRMQLLGSAIGNIMREKLSPVVTTTFNILARNNKLPELVPELQGKNYVINYISPLARAQKMLEINNLQQAMAIISQFGQVNPDVFDKIDFDKSVDYVADITNITPKIIRDDAEVADIRANRQQSQQMAMQMAALQQGAETTKTATEADKNIAQSQENK